MVFYMFNLILQLTLYFRLVNIAPMAIVAMLWSDTFRELLIGKNANNLYNNFRHTTLRCRIRRGGGRLPKQLLCFWRNYCESSEELECFYIFNEFTSTAFQDAGFSIFDSIRFGSIFNTIEKLRHIDGLKTALSDNEFYTVEKPGNKVIVLSSQGYFKGASDSGDFLDWTSVPTLCDGLVLKDKGSQVIYMGGS